MAKQTLLKNFSAKLDRFLQPILQRSDKPRCKFVRQTLWGILASGSLLVTEIARQIHQKSTALDYTAKRLCRELKMPTWGIHPMQELYLNTVSSLIRPDTIIPIDLSDLSKPRGRHFQYLAWVRDGDTGQIHPGYWCMEAYAVTGSDTTPLILEPFSVEDPETPGQNLVILDALSRLKDAFGHHGIYTFDRGFDGGEILNHLLDKKMRFILRLRGDRHLLLENNMHAVAVDIAERMRHFKESLRWRPRTRRFQRHLIGYQAVRLPGRAEPLYLVVSLIPGSDGPPMMLLTNLQVNRFGDAERVLQGYGKRWKAEEGIRLLKQEVALEGFRIRSLQAIRRLVFLAMLAIAFLVLLSLRTLSFAERLVRLGKPLRRARGVIYYRLIRGVRKLLTLAASNPSLIRSLQNG